MDAALNAMCAHPQLVEQRFRSWYPDDPFEAQYHAALSVAWRWQEMALQMDREMREMIEGALESENHLDSYNRVFKDYCDMQFKFSDAELALDAITGGNADLALKLVDRHVIGRGYRWGYRRATDLPRSVTKSVEKELRRLERKYEQRLLACRRASSAADAWTTGENETPEYRRKGGADDVAAGSEEGGGQSSAPP